MYKNSGIYLIKNKVNSKVYVGSAIDISKRWGEHRRLLINNNHNRHLQNSYNKYGKENFEYIIFESGIPPDNLLSWEQAVLDYFKSYLRTKGYNIRKFAMSNFKLKWSKESRMRASKAKKGKILTLEHRAKISESGKIAQNKPEILTKRSKFTTGTKNPKAVLTENQVREIKFKHFLEGKLSQQQIANMYKVSKGAIGGIVQNRTWKHITE